jgi:N-acetylmuramic acid 6-phosphate etherase
MGQTNYANLSTEKANSGSKGLDRLSPRQIVNLMNREDKNVLHAISRAEGSLSQAIQEIVKSLRSGGRLFFIGAGTSGRLGVIEAAECPPTFSTTPSMVQAVMAGGKSAVFKSKEGAEDSAAEGQAAVRKHRLTSRDTLVGIAASGVTPFVASALQTAKHRKTRTILLTCNPHVSRRLAKVVITLRTGPEILTGSTRLKAGSACKMALNILTTASMVQLGKAYGNRMVDLQPKSRKLVERGLRLIQDIAHVDRNTAMRLFQNSRRSVKVAIVMGRKKMSYTQAVAALKKNDGFLGRVL